MMEFAKDSFIIVHTLPESTKTFVDVLPKITGRWIASTEVVESVEDTTATQLSSSEEYFDSKSGSKLAEI